jgi:hypothetical protein
MSATEEKDGGVNKRQAQREEDRGRRREEEGG